MVIHVIVSSRYFTKRKPITKTRIALTADICNTFINAKVQNNLRTNRLVFNFLVFLHEKIWI